MTAPTVYRSTDGSAPVLDGQAGSLITVLDAVLVNGYGAKAAAGWTKAFSGTNGASYRQGGGLQYYVNVNDNAPGAGTGKEARVVGYEVMTAFATGSNLFPTAAQAANGIFVRKSVAADATARTWIMLADHLTFYMWVLTGDAANTYLGWGFGDIYSFKTSDVGRVFINARATENAATSSLDTMGTCSTYVGTTQTGMYLARETSQAVGAIACGKIGDFALTGGTLPMNGTLVYKNTPDGRIYLAPLRVTHSAGGNQLHGRMRGLWQWGHLLAAASDGDTITGAGDLNGKSFMVIKQSHLGELYVVETSNSWDTNA